MNAPNADSVRRVTDPEVIEECEYCDERGVAYSVVTGAEGRCRHPHVAYRGHVAERHIDGSGADT